MLIEEVLCLYPQRRARRYGLYSTDVSGGGTERSYLPLINLETLYGPPYGIRLRKGTTDRLIFTVQDDLTGLTTHNAIAYGVRI